MSSEIGEHTKTLAKRKDSGMPPIRRYQYFRNLDKPVRLPDGTFTQSKPFESGVLRAIARPTSGQSNLFQIVCDVSHPLVDPRTSGIPGTQSVLWAVLPNGSIWASEASPPTTEGRHQISFTHWRPMSGKLLERARRKGDTLSEIRKRQAQPLPPIRQEDFGKIDYLIS